MKKDKSEFYLEIINVIDEQPRTALEISKMAKTTWESTKNALKLLSSIEQIYSKEEGQRTLYFVNPKFKEYKTFFGMPISIEKKHEVESLFGLIERRWNKLTGRKPNNTQMYKVISLLNKNHHSLNLPIGWYQFGQITLIPYNADLDYSFPMEIEKEFGSEIDQIINKYKDLSNVKLKKQHYKDFEKQSYILKEKILDIILTKKGINKKSLIENLHKLNLELARDSLRPEVTEKINLFISKINNSLNEDREIVEMFEEIWKLIATEYFKKSFKNSYEIKILESCFDSKIVEQEDIISLKL